MILHGATPAGLLEFGPGTSYLYPIDPSAYANGQCPDNLAADISRYPPLCQSDLAQMANGSLSRLSHAVARLERHGWVLRATCPSDGRFTNATLTDAGLEKLAGAAPGHVAAVRQLVLDAVGADELAELGRIAVKVLEGPSGPLRSASGCPPANGPYAGRA